MSLLGFLGAGAANSYAQMKNAETDQQNKMGFAIIQAEMENSFRERLAERQHNLGIERDKLKQQNVRETKEFEHGKNLELENKKNEGRLKIEQAKGGIQRSNELLRQDRADARSSANIASRKEVALLNKSSSSSGGMSIKDLMKDNEKDEKEIHAINMKLSDSEFLQKDSMVESQNKTREEDKRIPQPSKLLKDRLEDLKIKVLERQRIIDSNGAAGNEDAGFGELAKILKQ